MKGAQEAAARLLARASHQRLDPPSGLVTAAAGIVIERDTPGAGFAGSCTRNDPGLALLVGAAVEASSRGGRRAELAELAGAVPQRERASALAASERFLAQIDPAWGAELIEEMLGLQAIRAHGALGLWLAARGEILGVCVPGWASGEDELRPLYRRQRAADGIVSAVARGDITSLQNAAFTALAERPPGRSLLSSEASAYLVAASRLDAAQALELAAGVLQTHAPEQLAEALYVVARAAVRAGLAQRVAGLARQSEFALEQAFWFAAAARSGALNEDAGRLESVLLARVEDELDPERWRLAAVPLLEGLAHAGAIDEIVAVAARWRVPPPLVVQKLFDTRARRAAAELSGLERLGSLFAVSEGEWDAAYDHAFGWSLTRADRALRLAACRDVLTLTAFMPADFDPGVLTTLWGPSE